MSRRTTCASVGLVLAALLAGLLLGVSPKGGSDEPPGGARPVRITPNYEGYVAADHAKGFPKPLMDEAGARLVSGKLCGGSQQAMNGWLTALGQEAIDTNGLSNLVSDTTSLLALYCTPTASLWITVVQSADTSIALDPNSAYSG
jgi:hypothetical protein